MGRAPTTKQDFLRESWKTSGEDRRRFRRINALYPAVFAVVLAVGGFLAYVHVKDHIVASLSEKLTTIQDSQEAAIRLYIDAERADVTGWAYETDIRDAIIELTDDDGAATPLDEAARADIANQLDALLTTEGAIGYAILDRSANIVLTDGPHVEGRRLAPGGLELVQSVLAGESRVTSPFVMGYFFERSESMPPARYIVKAAPVRNRNEEIVAALVVAVNPEEFSGILELGQFGETGESYVISRDAWMMSESRVREQLRSLGLIPKDTSAGIEFAFQVRDPGGDMTKGYVPDIPRARLPLTFAAAAVTSGDTGIELENYRNYEGVDVMGAWRWFDDLEFGLISEVEYSEALRPLRPLIAAFAGIFALLVFAVIGLLVYARIVTNLRSNIETVRQLGQYTLLDKIGEGGMGKVYRARHSLLARDTAVKLLKPDVVSEEAVARFEQEVQKTSQLQNPHTVEIYDYGRTHEGIFYYAMEFLDGYHLAELLDIAGPLPPARVVHIMRQVCFSLREAHRSGLIHRDIKPMNIVVCDRGGEFDVVKVLDFGLIKDVGVPDKGMTALNIIPGTPPYIAPERMKSGAGIDGRVDIYALGAVGFNLLTGEQVFDGDTGLEIAYRAMHDDPRRPSECADQNIPGSLDDLILATLARDPAQRPPDIGTLLRRLDDIAGNHPWDRSQAAAWWTDHPTQVRTPADREKDNLTLAKHASPT